MYLIFNYFISCATLQVIIPSFIDPERLRLRRVKEAVVSCEGSGIDIVAAESREEQKDNNSIKSSNNY
jgi:hypothetical protein